MVPERAGSSPASARSSVDFPQPLGPTMLVHWPGRKPMDKVLITTCSP
jgi:hypothetical protein